jgi:copper(I)-binding protein
MTYKTSKALSGAVCLGLTFGFFGAVPIARADDTKPASAAPTPSKPDPVTPPAVIKDNGLEITLPWLRATPGGAKVAGGYLTLANTGKEPDHLLSAKIPIASKGEVHEMSMDNGMMHMRELPDGLEIKPGETIVLKPGGYHLMFLDLKDSLKQGDMVEGTLTFAKAGEINVMFKVGGIADKTAPAADMPAQ